MDDASDDEADAKKPRWRRRGKFRGLKVGLEHWKLDGNVFFFSGQEFVKTLEVVFL